MVKYEVVFFCNYLNHHQVLVADEMYRLLDDMFCFVATLPRDATELKGGEDYSSRPYCILAAESEEAYARAMEYARVAGVCVFGACSQEYAVYRAVHNPNGLAFEVGERWLKRGLLNVLSPVLRTWWQNYHRHYHKANFFKLCASAFAAYDDERLGCYRNRHFKWGYFSDALSACSPNKVGAPDRRARLMWCARFINWKHPELAIECAKRLKGDGCEFLLDMYGDGVLRAKCEESVKRAGLSEVVRFYGNVPNDRILQAMGASDIFLFTSDCQEGWGVVANEAMAAGCCLVASNKIGAAPYLIRDEINGYMFRDRDADSLHKIVRHLIDNPEERRQLSKRGKEDMATLWSPRRAALNFIDLVGDLQNGRDTSITEGPCSKA